MSATEWKAARALMKASQGKRRKTAWNMRSKGRTFQQIGTHLGVTRQRAEQLVKEYQKLIDEGKA